MTYETGDILKGRIKEYPAWYHYGIVVVEEDGVFVYHTSPDVKNEIGGSIVKESLDDWLKSRELVQVKPTGIAAERIKKIATLLAHKNYNIYHFNCEHFLSFVQYEKWKSHQLYITAAISAALLLCFGTIIYINKKNSHK